MSLDVLSAIADSDPSVFNELVAQNTFSQTEFEQLLMPLSNTEASNHDAAVNIVQSLDSKNALKLFETADDEQVYFEKSDSDALINGLKEHNPVGFMGGVLAKVRQNPESGIATVLTSYVDADALASCETEDQKMTLLAKGFKSLGRAGNQNPEMMSQLLSELTPANVSTEMQTRLGTMLGDMVDSSDPSVGVDLIKDAMVGAMFKDSSLIFVWLWIIYPKKYSGPNIPFGR